MTETHATQSAAFSASISLEKTESARRAIFEGLFSSHSRRLYRLALRKLGNPADAEDALQDAFLSAFRHFDQFKGDAQISTWLTTIVLNTARMQLRSRSRRTFVHLDTPDDDGLTKAETLADARPDPEETHQREQIREVLERYVLKLSPKMRPAFRLRVLEGLSIREAAERLGISEGTLKAQFFRARIQITPHIHKAFGSPSKSRKRSTGAHVQEFDPDRAASTAERSPYRRVA